MTTLIISVQLFKLLSMLVLIVGILKYTCASDKSDKCPKCGKRQLYTVSESTAGCGLFYVRQVMCRNCGYEFEDVDSM